MKVRLTLVLLMFSCFTAVVNSQVNKPVITNYNFKFKVEGLKDVDVYLGFHFGDKKFIKDTAHVNEKGIVEFKGKDTLQGGIYLFITPRKNYFEFVVNENRIEMETDTANLVAKMKVKKSDENKIWYDYMQMIMSIQGDMETMKLIMDTANKESKEYKDAEAKREKLADKITNFREDVIKKKPKLWVSKLFMVMREIDIPDAPKNQDGTEDSLFAPRYYRQHYWDNIDFSDNRYIRSPLFESKLKTYYEKILPQIPDSVIPVADKMLSDTKGDPEMFKFICHYLTYSTERSKVMCMDRVFVHMIDTYYRTGKATWVDQTTMEKMIDRADKLTPLLCGEKVNNITLPDTNGVWHSLYDVKGDISILYFWDATCSHCKKSTPVLIDLYNNYLKPNGIEIFGVEGELDVTDYKKYLVDHNIPWLNVSDDPDINANPEKYILELKVTDINSLNFRHIFDLFSYPVVYILDKDKKIIAKKLGVEQIKEFIEKYKKVKAREQKEN